MNILDSIINLLNSILWDYILIFLLLGIGLYFNIRTRFIQIRLFPEMLRLLPEGIKEGEKEHKGISSFQALAVSVASRVGTGNLAGVAIAVTVGGPGAVFWMWIVALIGGVSACIESTLGQVYKQKDLTPGQRDHFLGGPAYYITKGMKNKPLGIVFAILMFFTFGMSYSMVQANTIGLAFSHLLPFGDEAFNLKLTALSLAVLTAWSLLGGASRIAKISSWVVPVMAIFYIMIALIVVALNIRAFPGILKSIFVEAFNTKTAVPGGLLGGIMAIGIRRGLFSNEAGMGSGAYAAASAHVRHPAEQGLLQTLGVFIDTLVVCSATAFIILSSNVSDDLQGIQLTQAALGQHMGKIGPIFIALAIFFFAYSSIIGNYFYCESNLQFLHANKKWFLVIFRLIVAALVFVGTISKTSLVWNMTDLFIALLAMINLFALIMLGNVALKTLRDYERKRKNNLPMDFKASDIGMQGKLDEWN